MKILDNPSVKLLVDTFNLEEPKEFFLQITKWECRDNEIAIKEVKVLDREINFLRFADIKKLGPHVHNYYISFGASHSDQNHKES